MNNGKSSLVEVMDLIDALFDGSAERNGMRDEQFDRLQSLIKSDAAARRYYVEALHLQAGLQWDHSNDGPVGEKLGGALFVGSGMPHLAMADDASLTDDRTASHLAVASSRREANTQEAGGAEIELPTRRALPLHRLYRGLSWSAIKSRPIGSSFLLAAAVVLVGLTIMSIWRIPQLGRFHVVRGPEEIDPRHSNLRIPARVARASEASNAEGQIYAANALIPYGKWQHVASGWLELETALGARIALEAPASFMMVDSNSVRLTLGQLSALVPAQAEGLTVLTPTARLVDRGTEFGVRVGGQGTTEIHVFQGRVDVTPVRVLLQRDEAAAEKSTLKLSADMAVRVKAIGQDDDAVEKIPLERSTFSRLSPKAGLEEDAFEVVPVVRYWCSAGKLVDIADAFGPYCDNDYEKLTSDRPLTPDYVSGRWAGFSDVRGEEGDAEEPQPQLDFELPKLDAGRRLSHVDVIYFVYHKSAIHAPSEMRVLVAENEAFDNPREITVARHFNDEDLAGRANVNWRCIRRIRVPLEGVQEKFIRLDIRNERQWTFLGLVRFYSAPDDSPEKEAAAQESP